MNDAPYHRPTAEEVEDWAFGLLEAHLRREGHVVANVRHPDRLNRSTRDVDILVEVDGRDIAVEVTQVAQTRQWWNQLDRLERGIRAAVDSEGAELDRGWLVLELNLLRTGSYQEIDAVALQIAAAVRRSANDLGAPGVDHILDLPTPAESLVEVRLSRIQGVGNRLSFISGNAATGGWTAPKAAAFVDQLLASKTTQGDAYPEMWILVVDSEVVIDFDEITEVLRERSADIPDSWTNVFFIPATDRSIVLNARLGEGAS